MADEKGFFACVQLLDNVTLTSDPDDNISDQVNIAPFTQTEMIIDYKEDAAETNNSALIIVELSDKEPPDSPVYRELSIAADQDPFGNTVHSILYPRRFEIISDGPDVWSRRWFPIPTAARSLRVKAVETGLSTNGGLLSVTMRLSNIIRTD